MTVSLAQDLSTWDGKSTAVLAGVYATYREEEGFADQLIGLLGRTRCQAGATWLLKACIEDGHMITPEQSSAMLAALEGLADWASKLHLLQCFPALLIAAEDQQMVERFLRVAVGDKNKFVRAWAYTGYAVLAEQHPDYAEAVRALFERAQRDEAPSVRARLRQIMNVVDGTRP